MTSLWTTPTSVLRDALVDLNDAGISVSVFSLFGLP